MFHSFQKLFRQRYLSASSIALFINTSILLTYIYGLILRTIWSCIDLLKVMLTEDEVLKTKEIPVQKAKKKQNVPHLGVTGS